MAICSGLALTPNEALGFDDRDESVGPRDGQIRLISTRLAELDDQAVEFIAGAVALLWSRRSPK